jgi:hypothetical protein
VVVLLCFLLVSQSLSGQETTVRPWPVKILERLLVPFRSNPFSQSSVGPCELGLSSCSASASASPSHTESAFEPAAEDSHRPILLELRTDHRGPFAHHWLALESPDRAMTIGYGPATLPFIDSGQVSLQDRYGNTKWISGMHPLPWLALPPIRYQYARRPGEGRIIGKPIPLSAAQSEALIRKWQHGKFVGPYIPIFHDCRTFTCATQASVQGKSAWPCYLFFKGYW